MGWASRPRCDQLPAWAKLTTQSRALSQGFDVRAAFAADPQRVARFSQEAPELFADLSKNCIDGPIEDLLFELARACEVEAHREAMFAGEPINNTEQRAVLHALLRTPVGTPQPNAVLQSALADVHVTLDAMLSYAEQVRGDAAITDIVNIGIGGSDLGPQMVVRALDAYTSPERRMHFVSNVDGHEMAGVLRRVRPESTLFLVASKTFTTAETMINAHSALDWFREQGGTDVARHFAALSTNVQAANDFGISTVFGFWDWVGGRYSLWSAIGLPIAIAIGAERFRELLAGAYAIVQQAQPHRQIGGRLVPQLPGLHKPQHRAVPQRPGTLARLLAAARDGEQRQARRPSWRATDLWHLARAVGRAGHKRPARVFSDAASGDGCRAGGIHRRARGRACPARPSTGPVGQCAGPGPGPDARQDGCRGAP
jgi:hypothetical protein